MSFALLIIFMIVGFGLTTLFRKWIDIPTLLAVAIGCACNANFFTSMTYPINIGPFTFSFEIVLYTLFIYTVLIRILDYGYNAAKVMTFTSIAAIIISAVIELTVMLSRNGFTSIVFKNFSYYLFSSVGTLLGVWLMIAITIGLTKHKVSCYIIIPLALVAASVVHSVIFYGGIALVNITTLIKADSKDILEQALHAFLGALVGKGLCIGLSVLCYFINKTVWIPNNLVKAKE